MEGMIKSIYIDKRLADQINDISLLERRSFSNQVTVLIQKGLDSNRLKSVATELNK